jgi:hypothetical protein
LPALISPPSGKGIRPSPDGLDRGKTEPGSAEKILSLDSCVSVGGINLHAGVAVPAGDRRRLERLARYMALPALASERLSERTDGRVHYELKSRSSIPDLPACAAAQVA